MNGWAPKLRRSLAAVVLGGSAAIMAFPASTGSADTAYHHFEYTCTDGALLPPGQRRLQVQVAVPTTVKVGERIPLEWTLDESPLASSGNFPAGGRLFVTGTADVAGLFQGKLDSTGTKDQAELRLSGPLELPTAMLGSVGSTKEGRLLITPRDLAFDFIPPQQTVVLNDTNTGTQGPIVYSAAWSSSGGEERKDFGDYLGDVHQTTTAKETVTISFTGTGIEYVTERHPEMGAVGVALDGVSVHPDPAPDASREADGQKVTTRKGQQVLWSVHNLEYKKHDLTLTNEAPTGKYMLVDAFKVITDQISIPPYHFRTNCHFTGNPRAMVVDVVPAQNNQSGGNNNDGNNSNNGNQHISDGDDSARGVIVLSGGGSGHGAPTETASPTPKASKTSKGSKASSTPQVRVTPRGGAHTGEAPEQDPRPGAFIAYGSVLLLGSVAGGLVLRRRRGRAG
ncbi:hypothetical protein ACWEN6_38700 [Sphaerisporangium sp. NPDC004334]